MNRFEKSWTPFQTLVLVCLLFHLAAKVNCLANNNNNEEEENDVANDFQTSERGGDDTDSDEDKDDLIDNLRNRERDDGDDTDSDEDKDDLIDNLRNRERDDGDDTDFDEENNGMTENLQNSGKKNQDGKSENEFSALERAMEALKLANKNVLEKLTKGTDDQNKTEGHIEQTDLTYFEKETDTNSNQTETAPGSPKSKPDFYDSLVELYLMEHNTTLDDVNITLTTINDWVIKELKDFEAAVVRLNEVLAQLPGSRIGGKVDDTYHGTTPGRAKWYRKKSKRALFEFNVKDILRAAEIKTVEIVLYKKPDPADYHLPITLHFQLDSNDQRWMWDKTISFAMHRGAMRFNVKNLFPEKNPERYMAETIHIWIECLTCLSEDFTSVFGHRNEERPFLSFVIKPKNGQKLRPPNHRNCNPNFECCKRDLEMDIGVVFGMDILGDHKQVIDYCIGTCDNGHQPYTNNSVALQYLRMTKNSEVYRDNKFIHREDFKLCCVPTSFAPISVTIRTDTSEPYREAMLDGMRVAECGCM